MTVTLYQANKKPNSTALPFGGEVFDCQVYDPCTILDPTIIIASGDPYSNNYAYIPQFGRYYFIRNWEWREARWFGYLSVDVLASFREAIGNSSQYIARSSIAADIGIQDNSFVATGPPILEMDTRETPWAGGTYVIGVTGAGGARYFTISEIDLANLAGYIFSNAYAESLVGDYLRIYPELKTQVNPSQYITSVTWFPITFASGGTVPISIGWVQTPVSGNILPLQSVFTRNLSFQVPKHPQGGKGSYLNHPPYASYYLRYPPFGYIPLDSDALAAYDTITAEVTVDPRTADAILRICGPDDQTIGVNSARLGVQIQLSHIVAPGTGAGAIVQAGAQGFAGLANTIGSALSGDIAGAISGGANLVAQGVQALGNVAANKIPSVSSAGGGAGGVASFSGQAQLTAAFTPIVSKDSVSKGNPLCKIQTVSASGGYMEIYWPHLELDATVTEIERIYQFMERGFYFE